MLRNSIALQAACRRLHALNVADLSHSRSVVTLVDVPSRPSSFRPGPVRTAPSRKREWRQEDTASPTPTQNDQSPEVQGPKRLLKPHILSSRLKKLCDAGQIDQAVDMLKNAPLDAQATPVWNTLIWECMKAQRFKLSYQLFTDMKRRGFKPTIRTFQTMFEGLSRIEDWESYPKQLENAHSLYDYLQKHFKLVKTLDRKSEELSVDPLASYIKILGDANEYQKMFDVYNAMEQEGRLASNNRIYTAMFQALFARTWYENADPTGVQEQNASDAKVIWRQALKASENPSREPPDSYTVAAALRVLSRGRPTDQMLALEIARDFLGLAKPGEGVVKAKIKLSPQTLDAVLDLCNRMGKYELCVHFVQQVYDNPKRRKESIIDCAHMHQVLRAHASLSAPGALNESRQALDTLEWMLKQEVVGENGPKIRPVRRTYNLVLLSCLRGEDWPRATRTFELMTGYHAEDFLDGSAKAVRDERSRGRTTMPDASTMSCMARIAFATGDMANMRQCLRMVNHVGATRLLTADSSPDPDVESRKADAIHAFYRSELAATMVKMAEALMDKNEGSRLWLSLKAQADSFLRRGAGYAASPIPLLREPVSRSVRRLADTEDYLRYEMASVHSGEKRVPR